MTEGGEAALENGINERLSDGSKLENGGTGENPGGADLSPSSDAPLQAEVVNSESHSKADGDTISVENVSVPDKQGKMKKRQDKEVEFIMRALSSLNTTEEKLAAMCNKYSELYDNHRKAQYRLKELTRKLDQLTREKEHVQGEHSKAMLAKSKLESLCRELQRHNKAIKDESVSRVRESEERRKEVSDKFQSTIGNIQEQMADNHQKNLQLREENQELAAKLKDLIEQFEMREKQMEKVLQKHQIEEKLSETRLEESRLRLVNQEEQAKMEKQQLRNEILKSKARIDLYQTQESALRSQIAMYTEKYEEFQTTLNKSNEVFGTFKSEMEKMTKQIRKLEKESSMWRQKSEQNTRALIAMAEEKTQADADKATLEKKLKKLENLCRVLQEERRKASGGVPPPPPPAGSTGAGASTTAAAVEDAAAAAPPHGVQLNGGSKGGSPSATPSPPPAPTECPSPSPVGEASPEPSEPATNQAAAAEADMPSRAVQPAADSAAAAQQPPPPAAAEVEVEVEVEVVEADDGETAAEVGDAAAAADDDQ